MSHLAKEIVHKDAYILPQLWVDGDHLLRDLLQLLHKSLVPEVVREDVCPVTVNTTLINDIN